MGPTKEKKGDERKKDEKEEGDDKEDEEQDSDEPFVPSNESNIERKKGLEKNVLKRIDDGENLKELSYMAYVRKTESLTTLKAKFGDQEWKKNSDETKKAYDKLFKEQV